MTDHFVLIKAQFFGPDEPEGENMLGPVLCMFLDAEGQHWIAFEVAEIAGVHVIGMSSRFFLAMGLEEQLLDVERKMEVVK